MTYLSKPLKVSLYNKIHRASSCLNFYVVREWKFVSNNPIQLLEEMSVEDRRVFNFDVREINWENYVTNYILGCRRFLLKDNIQTLQIARRNLNRYD
jgi:fatty acyl-CoA reductase